MAPLNPVRGEAKVTIGDVELVLVLTMEGLARVSAELRCESFQDLFKRLTGFAPDAVQAALPILAQSGTRGGKRLAGRQAAEAALASLSLDDLLALGGAFASLFNALRREGKDEGPSEKNAESARN